MKRMNRYFQMVSVLLVAAFVFLPLQAQAAEPFGLRRAVTKTVTRTVGLVSYDYPEHINQVTYTVKMTYFVNDNTGEIVDANAPIVTCSFEYDLEDEIAEGVQYTFESKGCRIEDDAQSVTFYFKVRAEDPYNEPSPYGGSNDLFVHYRFEDSFTYYVED